MRPDKKQYYLAIAYAVSLRSTCNRRKYGAVIVKNDRIVSTGYNGSPKGEPNCCDRGICWREEHDIPHGERYEACVGVHAEQNAMLQASAEEMEDATLYLAGYDETSEEGNELLDPVPCDICRRLIKNSGIKYVITEKQVIEV